ncbi:SpaH/EbpB family LPXTG-anchored major pilin [Gleimia hominis]|uniref:SpaH/EbpB family LPXTG-anchored major pilin n=1 Tax=Gleimia hominis TaxID=595468 RepID=A0ABU3I801_9ACTO|nr:SpaH/EbpB family LPXTG-anchored major pilin [Gleimia hominis]MDT3766510.1 SpaH/EbpB family LPXTG-anchored major pilin [Gleimia hominis]
MFTKTRRLVRSAVAAVGVLALTAMGVTAAQAETQIDPNHKGSITVHALNLKEGATAIDPTGKELTEVPESTPVQGAVFSLQKSTLNRLDNADFAKAKDLTPLNFGATDNAFGTNGTMTSDATGADGKVTFGNLDPGIYLLKQTVTPKGTTGIAPAIVAIPMTDPESNGTDYLYDVHVYPKSKTLENISKTNITDENTPVVQGSKMQFRVDTPIPSLAQAAEGTEAEKFTKFEVVDTPSGALQTDGENGKVLKVQVVTEKDTAAGQDAVTLEAGDYNFTNTDAHKATVSLTDSGLAKVQAAQGKFLRVEFEMTVVGNPADGIGNSATANIETDRGNTFTPTTPDDPENPVVKAQDITINKTDQDGKALQNAKFSIYKCDANNKATGNAIKVTTDGASEWTTDADGKATIGKVITGSKVCIVETQAPAGYEKLASPVVHTVDMDNAKNTVDIQNVSSDSIRQHLPLTGGAGIALFLLIGAGLLGGAYYYARKQREQA